MKSAQDILDVLWDGSSPVSIENLTGMFSWTGHKLVFEAFKDDTLVALAPEGRGYRVQVSSALSGTALRFAMAHALGKVEVAKAHNVTGDFAVTAKCFLPGCSLPDMAANKFALELLIPERMVHFAVQKGHTTVEALSSFFGVSEVALAKRLGQLGIV